MIWIPRATLSIALGIPLAASLACTSVGNVLFAPHPASLEDPKPTLALTTESGATCLDRKPTDATAKMVPAAAAGAAVAVIQMLLEKEAEQYKATYSAAGSGDLGQTRCLRFSAPGTVSLELELDPGTTAVRVSDGYLEVRGTQAKVAAFPWRTLAKGDNPFGSDDWSSRIGNGFGFVNPLMLLHFLWGLVDSSVYEVDIAARVQMDTVVPADRKTSTGILVIPIGKQHIDKIAKGHAFKKDIQSGYVAIPAGNPLLSNVTVSMVEANDLGDVVGKSAALVGENKKSLTDRLQGFLGLQ